MRSTWREVNRKKKKEIAKKRDRDRGAKAASTRDLPKNEPSKVYICVCGRTSLSQTRVTKIKCRVLTTQSKI
jgi:hypothetical protein